jgi:site-specific recombinase XerD
MDSPPIVVNLFANRRIHTVPRQCYRFITAPASPPESGVHRLRHSFCSHLAMGGAPARAIQELAGHMDLTTTQRYMHLSPAAIEGAIRLLDQAKRVQSFGDIVESVP